MELSGWRRCSNADTTRKRGDVLPGNESELCRPILHVIKEKVVRSVATDSEAPRSGWSGIPEPDLGILMTKVGAIPVKYAFTAKQVELGFR